MDEFQIAKSTAEIFDKLSNWSQYSTFDGSYDPRTWLGELDSETLQLIKLKTMTAELAMSRAKATNRDFETVLRETQLNVYIELARIFAKSIDPVVAGLREVVVGQDGEVCGVCQEEMGCGEEASVMGCMHKFHWHCIEKWLRIKNTCPLCRYQMEKSIYEF